MDISYQLCTAKRGRAARYRAQGGVSATCYGDGGSGAPVLDISASGMRIAVLGCPAPEIGERLAQIQLFTASACFECGPAQVVRVGESVRHNDRILPTVAIRFERDQGTLLGYLCGLNLIQRGHCPLGTRGALDMLDEGGGQRPGERSLAGLPRLGRWIVGAEPPSARKRGEGEREESGRFQLEALRSASRSVGPGRTPSRSAGSGPPPERFLCFDSSNYLGLDRHPRVREAVVNSLLHCPDHGQVAEEERAALERALAAFHGRDDALVFGAENGAVSGTLAAIVGARDGVLTARHGQEPCPFGSSAQYAWDRQFEQHDPHSLEAGLRRMAAAGVEGKLVLVQGVHALDGRVAPLPQLLATCQRHGARLLVDDTHGIGVLGVQGRGIQEHFQLVEGVDALAGSLGKSLGAFGSYVTGSAGLIDYLRSALPEQYMGAPLPAVLSVQAQEALQVLVEEPGLRDRLWRNVHQLAPALQDMGFVVSGAHSPILTVFVGTVDVLQEVGRRLSQAGIRCDAMTRKQPQREESYLRISLTAQHSAEDLNLLLEALVKVYRDLDLLGRTEDEIWEIGQARCS